MNLVGPPDHNVFDFNQPAYGVVKRPPSVMERLKTFFSSKLKQFSSTFKSLRFSKKGSKEHLAFKTQIKTGVRAILAGSGDGIRAVLGDAKLGGVPDSKRPFDKSDYLNALLYSSQSAVEQLGYGTADDVAKQETYLRVKDCALEFIEETYGDLGVLNAEHPVRILGEYVSQDPENVDPEELNQKLRDAVSFDQATVDAQAHLQQGELAFYMGLLGDLVANPNSGIGDDPLFFPGDDYDFGEQTAQPSQQPRVQYMPVPVGGGGGTSVVPDEAALKLAESERSAARDAQQRAEEGLKKAVKDRDAQTDARKADREQYEADLAALKAQKRQFDVKELDFAEVRHLERDEDGLRTKLAELQAELNGLLPKVAEKDILSAQHAHGVRRQMAAVQYLIDRLGDDQAQDEAFVLERGAWEDRRAELERERDAQFIRADKFERELIPLRDIEVQLTQANERIQALQDQLLVMVPLADHESLSEELKSSKIELDTLQRKFEVAKSKWNQEKQSLVAKLESEGAALQEVRAQLQQVEREVGRLENEKRVAQENASRFEAQMAIQVDEIANLEQELDRLQGENALLEGVQVELDEATQALHDAKEVHNQMVQDILREKERVQGLDTQLDELKQQADLARRNSLKKLDELNKKLGRYGVNVQLGDGPIGDRLIVVLNEVQDKLYERIQSLETQLNSIAGERDRLRNILEAQRVQFVDPAELSRLRSENDRFREQVDNLLDQLGEKTTAKAESSGLDVLSSTREDLGKLRQDLRAREEVIESLETQAATYLVRIAELELQLDGGSETDGRDLEGEVAALSQDLRDREGEIAILRQSVERVSEELSQTTRLLRSFEDIQFRDRSGSWDYGDLSFEDQALYEQLVKDSDLGDVPADSSVDES